MISDQGIRFINHIVSALTEELQIQHKKSTLYHPQENRTMEAFNKILEHTLTKVCNINQDDWDLKIHVGMWSYRTTCKIFMGKTPFKLVYGKESVIPMEYIVPILQIATATRMDDDAVLVERVV